MRQHKIIFSGPVGAGKTTAIAALSDIPPVATEQVATDETRAIKAHTTVAMDYGLMRLDDDTRVHLYATPGQSRFDFMWDILSEGAIGLILLIDNSRRAPLADLDFFLSAFAEFTAKRSVAVGVTRMDEARRPSLEDYRSRLHQHGLNVPVFEVDGREAEDVRCLVRALLHSLAPALEGPGE